MKLVPGFPLLAKELVERAARRRTYILRVVYAVLFFAPFVWVLDHYTNDAPDRIYGAGRTMFLSVVYLQFAGIYLFLPIFGRLDELMTPANRAIGSVVFSHRERLRISAGSGHRPWFSGLWPVVVVMHLLLAGGILLFLQQRCLQRAEALLRG